MRGKPKPDENELCLKVIRKLPAGQCYAKLKEMEEQQPNADELHSLFALRETVSRTYDSYVKNHMNTDAVADARMLEEDPNLLAIVPYDPYQTHQEYPDEHYPEEEDPQSWWKPSRCPGQRRTKGFTTHRRRPRQDA